MSQSELQNAASLRERWRTPHTVVQVWTCGSDYCDCEQAEVVYIEPNLEVGYPWIKPTVLAKGPFYTDGEGWYEGRVHVDAEYFGAILGLEYDRGR